MQSQKGKLELGKEYPPDSEEVAIKDITKICTEILRKDEFPVRRGQHAKHHGCVRAEFIVEDKVPESMKFGLFQEPGRRFSALIRFSNASSNATQPDSKNDARGMAIKLLDVEGV